MEKEKKKENLRSKELKNKVNNRRARRREEQEETNDEMEEGKRYEDG